MADVLTSKQRSYCMSQIKGKNTKPEIIIRKLLHGMGYRFRLHRKDLPGKPDIVLPKYSIAINVHGCFWHMHNCKYGKVKPQKNAEFWDKKRTRNTERDDINRHSLKKLGWRVLDIWECEMKKPPALERKLKMFIERSSP